MNKELLTNAYIDVLKHIDTRYLHPRRSRVGGPNGLSGLFLASVDDDYSSARNKVMVVGSETAGWEPLSVKGKIEQDDFDSVESYVARTMRKHQVFFRRKLAQATRDRGFTFHNFTRDIAKTVGEQGLIYTNLFCFDWRASSPMGCPEFGFVKQLSAQLLNVQIDLLKPDYIVFANGISSARYRREFFPVGAGMRCDQATFHAELSPKEYLWEFMLDQRIRCFRVHHPSARRKAAQAGRAGAIALLARAVSR